MKRKDSNKLTKRIGVRLMNLRLWRGETQADFANRLGITRGYLSDLERGQREMSVELLARVCKRVDTTAYNLLGV